MQFVIKVYQHIFCSESYDKRESIFFRILSCVCIILLLNVIATCNHIQLQRLTK